MNSPVSSQLTFISKFLNKKKNSHLNGFHQYHFLYARSSDYFPPFWILMCPVNQPFTANAYSQKLHLNGFHQYHFLYARSSDYFEQMPYDTNYILDCFSPLWILMCPVNQPLLANSLIQNSHLNGFHQYPFLYARSSDYFPPFWILMCPVNQPFTANAYSQKLQFD